MAEDEAIISFMIEQILEDEACIVIGPFCSVSLALGAAQNEEIDAAILDVNLAGEKVYPVAEALAKRNIPFLFLSGYGTNAVPPERPEWEVCCKPFRVDELIFSLKRVVRPKSAVIERCVTAGHIIDVA